MDNGISTREATTHAVVLKYLHRCPQNSLTWWLIKMVETPVSAVRRIATGLTLLGVPVVLSGLLVAQFCHTQVFTRSVLFAVVWLVSAPMLIRTAFSLFANYMDDVRACMREEDWHQYVDGLCRLLLSSRHMWLSVPLGLAFGFIAWRQSCSLGLPDAHMAWCVVTMGGLGFTAGIGFWGVMGLVEVIQGLQKHELTLDAGHPDGFGGLRCAGSLLASWVALFYSGSLLFPYAFDVIRGKSPTADAEMVTYVMMGAFMLIGLVSFACGVARLHRIGFDFKIRADRESSARLEALMEESVHVKGQDLATVLRPLIYYHVSHQRVGEMKEYPYDARTLLELSASVLIPILVAVLDKVFR